MFGTQPAVAFAPAVPSVRDRHIWPQVLIGIAGGYSLIGGALALAGWVWNIPRLKDWENSGISMKTNASIAALACGVGVLLSLRDRPVARVLQRGIGAGIAMLAVLTLVEHLASVDLGIDTLLYDEPPGSRATTAPNRMGIPASTCLLLIGIAIALLPGSSRLRRPIPQLGCVVLAITGISLLGALFNAEATYTIPHLTAIALQTSSMLWFIGLALILSVRERSPMRLVLDDGTAGRVMRRAAPLVILLPILLAYIGTVGEDRGYYDAPAGRALLVVGLITLMLSVVFWCGELILKGEAKAVAAERDHALRSAALNLKHADAQSQTEAVIDALSEPLAIFDAQGEVVRTNPAFRALHHLPVPLAETVSLPDMGMKASASLFETRDPSGALVPPDRWPVSRALAGESVRAQELRVFRPDQEWSYTGLFNAEPLRSSDGAVTGVVLTVEDVTNRRLAEDIYLQQYGVLSALFAQAPVGVYVVDDQFRFQQVNAVAVPVFAHVQPLIGRDFAEVVEVLWGPEVGANVARIFRNTLKTGERYVSPRFDHIRQDIGVEQSYQWETQRITLPHGRFGVVCYFTDVTETERAATALRESEQRTRLATEATGVGIREWNVAANWLRWNDQMFHIYGMQPTVDGLVDFATWRSAILPEDVPGQDAALKAILTGAPPGRREFRIVRTDGQVRHISAVDTVRVGSDGVVRWVVGTCLDVTESKAAALLLEERVRERTDALGHAQAALRRVERLAAIGTLAAGLGHDLGNLMMPLWMRLDLLERKHADLKHSPEILGIRDGLKYLQRLSTALRQMAADPDSPPPPGGTAIPAWWEEIEGMVRASLPRGVALHAEVSANLPPVNVGSGPLTQAIFNLVQNAGEALSQIPAPPDGRRIRIALAPSAFKAGWVDCSVSDNGPGMTPEVVARCFEAYYSTKGRAVSTGLGLALVRGVAEAAGGSVQCASTPGEGATFTLRLPPSPGMMGGPQLVATLSIGHPRLAALAKVLLQSMGVEVKPLREGVPAEGPIWITDHRPAEELAAFIASPASGSLSGTSRTAIVLEESETPVSAETDTGVLRIGPAPTAIVLRTALLQAIGAARQKQG